jgi:2-haloacid dehalogenase
MIMDIAKREFLAAGLGLGLGVAMAMRAEAQTAPAAALKPSLQGVKVIVFDTFGSVVDWRGSIIKDLTAWGAKEGLKADWAKLADDWRLGKYGDSMNRVRTGKLPWMNLEELQAMTLKEVLPNYPSLKNLTPDQEHYINMVWRRLDGWPDSVKGLTRLKSKYIIGPLSNGSVALLADMAKHAKLPWDNIFSCELFKHYKPDPETYLGVVKLMELKPEEVMMGAAHPGDLDGAKKCGLKTAFFPRPLELGPDSPKRASINKSNADGHNFDIVADNIEDFARQMGT